MWNFLNSRKVAVYLLTLFLGILLGSAFVPSPFTVTPQEWQSLQQQGGARFWLYSHLATPFIVSNPLFAATSLLLFLSTLVCTVDRARRWWRSRSYEFAKERAFSFSVQATSARDAEALENEVESLLAAGRWDSAIQRDCRITISAQKGMAGFWGSMVFHLGLLICFLTAPVTLLTGYKGQLTLLEDDTVTVGQAVTLHEGSRGGNRIDNARVTVSSVRGQYYQGKFRYDFGGKLTIEDGSERQQNSFAVNDPTNYHGFQFSLDSFGYAPHLVIKDADRPSVDTYLNLSGDDTANYFGVASDLRAFVLFFPDFIREGGKVGTRSKNLVNPVTMVKLYRGDREVFKGLFRPGEEALWEGRVVSVPDVKHWVSFSVAREYGIVLVMVGFFLVVSGLFVRFLSNERRIEFDIEALPVGSACRVRGYSRYYPAFLEKEVLQIAERLK